MSPSKMALVSKNMSETIADKVVEKTTTQNITEVNNGGTPQTLTWTKVLETQGFQKHKEAFDDATVHKLSSNKWGFSLDFYFPYDPSYMSTSIYKITRNSGADSAEFVPPANCNSTNFPMTEYARASATQIEYEMCPAAADFELYGDLASKNAKFILITFWKCTGSTSCKNSTQISSWATRKTVKFTTINSFFDESKGEVAQYLDYNLEVYMTYDWYFRTSVEIVPTELVYKNGTTQMIYEVGRILQDKEYRPSWSIFGEIFIFVGPKKRKIVQSEIDMVAKQRRELQTVTTNNVTNTTATSGSTKKTTEQEEEQRNDHILYRICNIMAQIGGFTYFLKMVFGTLLGLFSENLQAAYLINWVKFTRYSAEKKQENLYNLADPTKEKPIAKKATMDEEKKESQALANLHQLRSDIVNGPKQETVVPDSNISKMHRKENKSDFISKRSKSKMSGNLFVPYTYFDVVRSTLCRFKCRKQKQLISSKNDKGGFSNLSQMNATRLGKSLQEDKAKLYKEIDIINVVNSIKELKAAIRELSNNSAKHMEGSNQNYKNEVEIQGNAVNSEWPAENNNPKNEQRPKSPDKEKKRTVHRDEINSISHILSRELDNMIHEASFQQDNEKVPLKSQNVMPEEHVKPKISKSNMFGPI